MSQDGFSFEVQQRPKMLDALVRDIPAFMQLVQGRTAQAYNNRTNRKGACWEDRYHATAIASDEHIIHCMVYISMNMVRAGVVDHPEKWKESGYFEIQHPKKRYTIIDYASLLKILNIESIDRLQQAQQAWIKDALEKNNSQRNGKWTAAIAHNSWFIFSIFTPYWLILKEIVRGIFSSQEY